MDDATEILRQAKIKLVEKGDLKLIGNAVDIQNEEVELAYNIFLRYYHLFEKGKVYGCTPDADVLNQGVLKMLSYCLELNIFEVSEIKRMDREAYMMLRNLVEWCELRKEKSEFCGEHLLYLEKEYQVLMDSWVRFLANARAVLTWQKNTQKMAQLVQLKDFVGNILNSKMKWDELISAAREAYTILSEYKRSIPASIVLTPLMVARSANRLIGVPTSWLLNSFQPPLDCLEERLRRKVVGQDLAIKIIAHTMSRARPGGEHAHSPLASFIILPDSDKRLTEFFESLAEELYDSKDRLIQFELDVNPKGSCSSNVHPRDRVNAVRKKVLEVVKNVPFCALLFENVNACESATDFLESILEYGLTDDEGITYDLSNTLILMTYTVGIDVRNGLFCKCLELGVSQMRTMSYNECNKLPSHIKALETLGRMHVLVDDVVALKTILPRPQVLTRIQLREVVDASWRSHRRILYTSEAVMQMLTDCLKGRELKAFLRKWLKKKVLPSIHPEVDGEKTAAGDMTAIHIDVLVASRILSYRSLEFDSALDVFKESLKRWKTVYLTVKKSSREIVKLCTRYSDLLLPMQNMNETDLVMTWFKDLGNVLDDIISCTVNCNNLLSEQELVPPNTIQAEIACWQTDYPDLNERKPLIMRILPMILEEKYHVTDYIIDSISSNGFETTQRPKLFLCLGLTDTGKADLVADLNESLKSCSEGKSVIQMNMEEYGESDSLMQFLDHVSALVRRSSSEKDSRCSKRKRTLSIPGVVLLIDRVGEAHVSVLGAFLSMLDRGSLESREGESVDFCKAAVIVMSDLGSKEILARIAQNANGIDVMEGYSEKERYKLVRMGLCNRLYGSTSNSAADLFLRLHTFNVLAALTQNIDGINMIEVSDDKRREKPFRSELLNRIDAVLMLDPLLEKQLQKFLVLQVGQVAVASRQLPYLLSIMFSEIEHRPLGIRRTMVSKALRILKFRAA